MSSETQGGRTRRPGFRNLRPEVQQARRARWFLVALWLCLLALAFAVGRWTASALYAPATSAVPGVAAPPDEAPPGTR